jgi:hypothetical protein
MHNALLTLQAALTQDVSAAVTNVSGGYHMARKRKAKKTKPKRTAKKSKRKKWSAPKVKKWSAPEVDVFDEALERAGKATLPNTFRCR